MFGAKNEIAKTAVPSMGSQKCGVNPAVPSMKTNEKLIEGMAGFSEIMFLFASTSHVFIDNFFIQNCGRTLSSRARWFSTEKKTLHLEGTDGSKKQIQGFPTKKRQPGADAVSKI